MNILTSPDPEVDLTMIACLIVAAYLWWGFGVMLGEGVDVCRGFGGQISGKPDIPLSCKWTFVVGENLQGKAAEGWRWEHCEASNSNQGLLFVDVQATHPHYSIKPTITDLTRYRAINPIMTTNQRPAIDIFLLWCVSNLCMDIRYSSLHFNKNYFLCPQVYWRVVCSPKLVWVCLDVNELWTLWSWEEIKLPFFSNCLWRAIKGASWAYNPRAHGVTARQKAKGWVFYPYVPSNVNIKTDN